MGQFVGPAEKRGVCAKWLIIAIVLHSCEEILALGRMPHTLAEMRMRFGLDIAMPPLAVVQTGLAGFMLVPALILSRSIRLLATTASPRPIFVICMIAAMTGANALMPHLFFALASQGYVPGLVTAITLTLPIAAVTLGMAWRENWMSGGLLLLAIATGIALLPFVLAGFWALAQIGSS